MGELVMWMVTHRALGGPRSISGVGLTESDADALVRELSTRGHKQVYEKFSYTRSTRAELICREGILE